MNEQKMQDWKWRGENARPENAVSNDKWRTKWQGEWKMQDQNAEAETWAPTSGRWLRYVITRQLKFH